MTLYVDFEVRVPTGIAVDIENNVGDVSATGMQAEFSADTGSGNVTVRDGSGEVSTDTGSGAPEGRRRGGIAMRNLNALTPESERTTHYFWAQAHDFRPDDSELTEFIFEEVKTAFLQDLEVFQAQQRVIDLDRQAPTMNLPSDAGGVQALRLLDRLVAEDAGDRAAAE